MEGEDAAEIAVIVPAEDDDRLARAAAGLARELDDSLSGFHLTIGRSRHAADPVDLYRAGNEARLAVNVGEAEGRALLAFEDTGSYRLLLPAMSEDPRELERFYAETIAPLAAYDEQYETELVTTVEAYLDNDGNVAATAKQLFTHRHTIRYRLERVKELCGHDVSATEGREKLGLGLKAMRVLGIASPRGPALEPGAEAGKVAAVVGGVGQQFRGTFALLRSQRTALGITHPGSEVLRSDRRAAGWGTDQCSQASPSGGSSPACSRAMGVAGARSFAEIGGFLCLDSCWVERMRSMIAEHLARGAAAST